MEKEEKRADQENDTEEQSTEAKSLLKKKLQYYSSEIQRDVGNLVKWLMLAVLVGCITGAASTLFSFVLKSVTNCRKENEWMFYLLPVMGLIIVYLYEKFGKDDGGTNQVLSTVRSQDDVPILSAPLIFISTALTHLAGGSAGREGAAIQLGGSIANQLGRWIHLDEEDRHVIVMCGMSAAFSALFGTPMAAAVFALEVVSVGVMYYTALMPCMIASLVASGQFPITQPNVAPIQNDGTISPPRNPARIVNAVRTNFQKKSRGLACPSSTAFSISSAPAPI